MVWERKTDTQTHSQTEFYNSRYVGVALESFTPNHLPLKCTILQRYHALRSHSHNVAQNVVISTITRKLFELWDCSAIPHINLENCLYKVKQVVYRWVSMKKKDKIGQIYQGGINTLLNFRPVSCSTLPTLNAELQKLRGNDWEEDYDFFKGQLEYP